ncbi:MAG: bifunctional nicotinamidase/pyrazinamidase [Promethearchaeota archaeon]|nr:MAG: bifunctional nicotinamidase/pyrazinamidase [Candidatus Lokiarchaeota archaeon]
MQINQNDALLIVDIQNDFLPGGALAVEEGDQIINGINKVAEIFRQHNANIILTQDWHPPNHLSFASNHPGKEPGDEYQSEAIGPVLWPDHCVQGTYGAEFHKDLKTDLAHVIIRKGYNPEIDSYSGFLENDKKSETGLAGLVNSLKIKRIFICGLALDYCCFSTAMDGIDFGFEVNLIIDLTKGIDLPQGSISNALKSMVQKGVNFSKEESLT